MANYFEKASRLKREIKKEYDTELIFDTIDFYGEQALLEVINKNNFITVSDVHRMLGVPMTEDPADRVTGWSVVD